MKRFVLISTLLLVFILTAGTAPAQIILPPGWPFLPPIISPPVIETPPPAYYRIPMAITHTPIVIMVLGRGSGLLGYGGRGYYGSRVRVTGVMGVSPITPFSAKYTIY